MNHRNYTILAGILLAPFLGWAANPAPSATNLTAPPLPAIRALKIEPAALKFHDGRHERGVLVLGQTDAGKFVDLTAQTTFKTDATNIVLRGAAVIAKSAGTAEVTISAAGYSAKLPVTVESAAVPPVRFVRDIEPVLSKVGCNAGTCHGSAKGKNGFKLSLRGYDPDFDYEALVNDISGRRFNRVNVDESLMLQKPTGEVPHEGRQAIKPGSREFEMLRAWIAEGAKPERTEAGRATKIEVLPAEIEMDLAGRAQQLLVIAHYADDTTRDVTRDAIFSSSNTDVAEVKDGQVRALRRGEAAVLIRYEGIYATKELTVMGDRAGYEWANTTTNNFIDQHVYAKLQRIKALPSELCTDSEFIRRVALDLTGLPPKAERVRAFLADTNDSKLKRDTLIDQLI
ncbi:MAG TPA: DUF1549 domain-containing protein, partial [Candidatus Acidoferrum sp.]|nr:DUF1549 domain-containing protein [Candidatus Acidoferrum sp.]